MKTRIGGARWFPYATVYSSGDGTGWYCMPEIGDKIRLYFPTEKEQDAYVISAYHEGNGGLRKNPQCNHGEIGKVRRYN